MLKSIERREHFRIDVDCEIDYRFLNSDDVYKARCSTLSDTGISFITSQMLQPETELEIIIQSSPLLTSPMRARIKVKNIRSLKNKTFEIGASMSVLP